MIGHRKCAVVKEIVLIEVLLRYSHVAMTPFHFVHTAGDSFRNEINNLTDVEDDAKCRGPNHEVGEDFLFCWMTNVAVHLVRTWGHLTFDEPRQIEAVVHHVENVEEGHLDARFHKEADQISPPQASMLFPCVVVELLGVFPIFGLKLSLTVITVGHMHDHHEGRACDKDELQGPQADMRDGEEEVIADIGTARLFGVTVKILLLIPPHSLCCHHIHHHSEHEHHGQPHSAKCCGVLVHPTQQGLESLPVHVPYTEILLMFNQVTSNPS